MSRTEPKHEGKALTERLRLRFPVINPRLTAFPSGAFMVDINLDGNSYVVEYLPSIGVLGLSRLDTAVFGWEGFDEALSTEIDLQARIEEILRGPGCSEQSAP